jgi:hypothetical protein
MLSEDGRTAGGIYLWTGREAAEAIYTESWRAFVRDKYAADPSVIYMASPAVVDNLSDEIIAS